MSGALGGAFIQIISLTPPNSLRKEVPLGTAFRKTATWLREMRSPVGTHLATVQREARVAIQRKGEFWVTFLQTAG